MGFFPLSEKMKYFVFLFFFSKCGETEGEWEGESSEREVKLHDHQFKTTLI